LLPQGVAFKKTFSYAGFEQQPKSFTNPRILLLNIELELKAERENAEIRLDDPAAYQSIVDAEWSIIYEKLENCHAAGAQIVLSRLAIGDLATQWFADRGVFCAGRVAEEDLQRVAKATGARVQTTVNKLDPKGAVRGVKGLAIKSWVRVGVEPCLSSSSPHRHLSLHRTAPHPPSNPRPPTLQPPTPPQCWVRAAPSRSARWARSGLTCSRTARPPRRAPWCCAGAASSSSPRPSARCTTPS